MKRNALKECFQDSRGKLFFLLSTAALILGLIAFRVIPLDFKYRNFITMGLFLIMIIFSTLFSMLLQLYQNQIDKEEGIEYKTTHKSKKKK